MSPVADPPPLALHAQPWPRRAAPLTPRGAVAEGEAARRLVERLLQEDDEALGALEGSAAEGIVVIRGPEIVLPWVDRLVYFGAEPEAPELFVPTTRRCPLPPALTLAALRRASGQAQGALLALPDPLRVLPLSTCRALRRAALVAWLSR
ncbi:hypothetical protein L6R49_31015 [Myxococcota bacterium]|nr:hypothetical protein [Myxococcota bacterium]